MVHFRRASIGDSSSGRLIFSRDLHVHIDEGGLGIHRQG